MRAWLYYRLSRDEDEELHSLQNQRSIIEGYALNNGYEIVGESFDDNISGMHFDRDGITKLCAAVDAGLIDAVIVKDLSRLGRHRTQTSLFIDYLRENHVRVVSATENIDTFNENDDLIIGFKGLVNDFYARDGSRRVRTGYRQKQKAGIVITPPFGYFKDKNTNRVEIVPEAAETVQFIYAAYLGGSGMRSIAKQLNANGSKTPSRMQRELIGKRMPNQIEATVLKKYLWDATIVNRILRDESYIGTLICHKSERNKINKTFRFTDPEEQFRHENYFPAIIQKDDWERVQELLEARKKHNVRASTDNAILRYSGLLACGDCGRSFTGKRIKRKSMPRVEYVCTTYQRYGKEHCSSHALREEYLDEVIRQELLTAKDHYQDMWESIEASIDTWVPSTSTAAAQIRKCKEEIIMLEEEMEAILMERIRDKSHAERYDRMIRRREEQIDAAKKRIDELENISRTIRERQAKLKKDISLIDDILADEVLSEAQLRMLIEKIYVYETDEGLSLDIRMRAPFVSHTDSILDGVLSPAAQDTAAEG